jgi:alpha-beta hydrolase superfamily lysophospholipase
MKERIEWIKTDDISFFTRIWSSQVIEPTGVLLLIHGSVEHSLRYEAFAKALTEKGYLVVAPDLRGHGQTGLQSTGLGYFSDRPMGWELAVHDLKVMYDKCLEWYPDLQVTVFGHSMGSYLVRCFLKEYPVQVSGVILSGTGAFAAGVGDLGIWLSKLTMRLKGRSYKSRFLTDLVYGSLNKRIGKTQTPFDFLTRDSEEVAAYIKDPLCGYTCSAEFIHEMLVGTKKANALEMFQLERKALPMLIISGDNDPVGDRNGRGIKKVVKQYTQSLENVTAHFYEGARHELLNELYRQDVIEDIFAWLSHVN